MKKTLIALAVAVSSAVSGSAMAWTTGGTGGTFEMGGTLTQKEKHSPWEAEVGAAVTNLDATLEQGSTSAEINLGRAIPILGVRTVSSEAFVGEPGLTPMISYGDALHLNEFENSSAPLFLDVKNDGDVKIGTVEAPVFAAGVFSSRTEGLPPSVTEASVFADASGEAFFGGLSQKADGVVADPTATMRQIWEDAGKNYSSQDAKTFGSPSVFINRNLNPQKIKKTPQNGR
ncbi:fimbrial protein [Escherichia coli]|uniref:F4 family fimbrial subunit n=1 Tax=Escherichia coli TaxID=562 RepID=UPI0035709AE8